jgi:hypothetical protein
MKSVVTTTRGEKRPLILRAATGVFMAITIAKAVVAVVGIVVFHRGSWEHREV